MTQKDIAKQVIDALPKGAMLDDIIHALYAATHDGIELDTSRGCGNQGRLAGLDASNQACFLVLLELYREGRNSPHALKSKFVTAIADRMQCRGQTLRNNPI
jgi:hypothetical protein